MAITGNSSGSFNGQYPSYATPYIFWSYEQSIPNNNTVLTVTLKVKRNKTGSTTYKASTPYSITIGGTKTSGTMSFKISNVSAGEYITIGSASKTISHNSDGTASAVSISASIDLSGTSLGTGSVSTSVTPNTIYRASTPTLSSSSVAMGNSVTIYTNRASENFTHTLTYYFGNTNGTIATGVGANYTWTPSTSLASQIANTTSGTCTIYCDTYNGNTYLGTKTITMTLSVPSASVPTLSASSVVMGNSVTITTNRKSSNFTHVLYFSFGGISWRSISSGVGTSVSWTPSIDLASQIPNATSGTCIIHCETYNGSAYVGTQAITLNLKVPDSVVPTISNISISAGNTEIPASWGVYVQGKSQLKVTVTASGAYGSTIATYKTTGIENNTYWASSFISATLQESGTKTITVKVVDSRGREATKTINYTCVAYNNPNISVATVTRCNADGTDNEEGECVKYSFKADIAPVSNKNTYSYKLGYKKNEDYSYEYITISNSSYSLNKADVVISDVEFSVDNSYDFEFLVNDYFTNATITRQLGTGFTLLDFNASGKGMAIGKVSEKDALEIGMPVEFGALERYSGDLNDIDTTKTVYCNGATNAPKGFNGYCVTLVYTNSYKKQTYHLYDGSYTYERVCVNGQWGFWLPILVACGTPITSSINRGAWNEPTKGLITQIGDDSSSQHSVIVGLKSDGVTRNYGMDLYDSDTNPIMRLYAGERYLELSYADKSLFTNGLLKSLSNGNQVSIGSQNASYCHISSNMNIPFYFNRDILINDGKVRASFSLYDNSSGSNGTITLSDNAANYNILEIFYRDNNGNDFNCTRVFGPNGKNVYLSCIEAASTPATNIRTSRYAISGKSMTVSSYTYTQIPSKTSPTVTANNYLYVTKVIGYK